MRYLKQSTAIEVKVGPFLDETDGKTAETGLTISQADVRLAKNAADWAQKTESTTLVHEENGWYRCLLDTTDTDTLGILMLAIHESGALPVWAEFHVLPANVYDSMFSTDLLQVDAQQWLGGTIATPTTTGVPEVDITHYSGTAVGAPDTAGYPKVTIKDGTGTGEIDTASGAVMVRASYKKNTAISNYMFQMVDATDGYTPETGLTPTCTRSLDGAAFGACANSASEVASGWYKIDLAAADLNADEVVLRFTGTGSRNWEHKIRTIA